MVKKGKPMPIELQRDIIGKIILKRGNTGPRKTVEGKLDYNIMIPTGDSSALDVDAILDNLDPESTLGDNIAFLEREGFLLPVPYKEMDDYKAKQLMRQQEELEAEEKVKRIEQLKEFYNIKHKRPKRVIVDGEIHFVEE